MQNAERKWHNSSFIVQHSAFPMILDRILEHKRREVKEKKNARYIAELKAKIRDASGPIGFFQAVAGPSRSATIPHYETTRLIAEVNMASLRRGVHCDD